MSDASSNPLSPRFSPTLRTKLFITSALLSTAILLIAAWVINNQVVGQARQQVRTEVEDLLPVYDSIWDEQLRNLTAIGTTMANASITKTVLGNSMAAKDRETLHEMIADISSENTAQIDLILISDGAGNITFAEVNGEETNLAEQISSVKMVAESQQQTSAVVILNSKLYQLTLTPILLQSGNTEYQNTLAVLGVGAELSRAKATKIQSRIHSEVVFLAQDKIYASSLTPEAENRLTPILATSDISRAEVKRPIEMKIEDRLSLAFSRQLLDFQQQRIGQVIVIRSLEEAGKLFRSISNLLLLLWTMSIAAAFLLSYFIAGRITQPVKSLIESTREVGKGNYDHEIKAASHGELGELANAFDLMRRSLRSSQNELLKQERLATIGQMASSIVHDLRNPLAAITTASELLQRESLAPDRRLSLLENQMKAAQRMQVMLAELLDFSRGNYQLNLQPHQLLQIVERSVNNLLPQLRARVKIWLEVPPEFVIKVDEEHLVRVIDNLLLNACQAIPKDKNDAEVTIRASSWNSMLKLEIQDNGTGIPLVIQDRLFEPFVSQGKYGGTGLGLAIARGIVEAHGGQIGVEGTSAEGTKMFLTLPNQHEG